MELQLALDVISDKKGMDAALAVGDLIDVLELGTPFLFTYSLATAGEFKKALPNARILADCKIMDGGAVISGMAFDAGADVTSVSARTWDGTIEEVIREARSRGKQVLVDMMGVPNNEIAVRGREIDALGADYICVHRAVSVKGASSPEEPLRILRDVVGKTKIAVAGGITAETLEKLAPHRPDLVIVGSAIANAPDPRAVAVAMRKIMEETR